MSLTFNLRHLESRDLRLKGELPVAELDLDLKDELIRAEKPLRHDLRVEKLEDSILVTGSLRLALDCECARCLKSFKQEVKLESWALHLPLEGEDAVPIKNDSIDLTPFVREDMLLELPQHPLCKPDCGGLKPAKTGKAKKNEGKDESKPSVWSALNKLKL